MDSPWESLTTPFTKTDWALSWLQTNDNRNMITGNRNNSAHLCLRKDVFLLTLISCFIIILLKENNKVTYQINCKGGGNQICHCPADMFS
jgi:hypothetical protein